MIASHEMHWLDLLLKDKIKSIRIQKMAERISTEKIMAKYLNKSKHYEAYFAFFGWAIL